MVIKSFTQLFSFYCLCMFLFACSDVETFAPVTELSSIEPLPKTGIHRVKKGETLYEIAWRYGLDYRYLATRNRINAPYAIYVGELIYLRGRAPAIPHPLPASSSTAPVFVPLITAEGESDDQQMKRKTPLFPLRSATETRAVSLIKWTWPAKGEVINRFASDKGVNILGTLGEPIYAAASGQVVYAGRGLRSYGNLIILKHNSVYLSAYAHNNALFVKEGEWVKQGQKIAEMGHTGTDKNMLHFEIRREGRPVNPISLYR